MFRWGQIGLQEASTFVIEALNYFHDYIMFLLLIILVFVSSAFFSICTTSLQNKYTMDSHLLETIWTVVPMVILLFMAFPSLALLYIIEDISSPDLTVKVVGHQWYWEYQYFNSWFRHAFDSYMIHESDSYPLFYTLDVDNRLTLPTLASLLFLITSADVLHSWTVPTLGVKADACPGRLNYVTATTMFSGLYYGQCREICGANHRFMPIVLEFVPMSNFLDSLVEDAS